jgi:hypothetical protein
MISIMMDGFRVQIWYESYPLTCDVIIVIIIIIIIIITIIITQCNLG